MRHFNLFVGVNGRPFELKSKIEIRPASYRRGRKEGFTIHPAGLQICPILKNPFVLLNAINDVPSRAELIDLNKEDQGIEPYTFLGFNN